MARLTWKNVTAPDFSDAIQATYGAGNQIGKGFNNIGGAADDYRNFIQEQASNKAMLDAAQFKDSASWDAAMANGGEAGLNIAPGYATENLSNFVNDRRTTLLGNENTQAGTAYSKTQNANAIQDQTMENEEYAYDLEQRGITEDLRIRDEQELTAVTNMVRSGQKPEEVYNAISNNPNLTEAEKARQLTLAESQFNTRTDTALDQQSKTTNIEAAELRIKTAEENQAFAKDKREKDLADAERKAAEIETVGALADTVYSKEALIRAIQDNKAYDQATQARMLKHVDEMGDGAFTVDQAIVDATAQNKEFIFAAGNIKNTADDLALQVSANPLVGIYNRAAKARETSSNPIADILKEIRAEVVDGRKLTKNSAKDIQNFYNEMMETYPKVGGHLIAEMIRDTKKGQWWWGTKGVRIDKEKVRGYAKTFSDDDQVNAIQKQRNGFDLKNKQIAGQQTALANATQRYNLATQRGDQAEIEKQLAIVQKLGGKGEGDLSTKKGPVADSPVNTPIGSKTRLPPELQTNAALKMLPVEALNSSNIQAEGVQENAILQVAKQAGIPQDKSNEVTAAVSELNSGNLTPAKKELNQKILDDFFEAAEANAQDRFALAQLRTLKSMMRPSTLDIQRKR